MLSFCLGREGPPEVEEEFWLYSNYACLIWLGMLSVVVRVAPVIRFS